VSAAAEIQTFVDPLGVRVTQLPPRQLMTTRHDQGQIKAINVCPPYAHVRKAGIFRD
jgi:hypothetical protein